jgi:hypothetical protein
LGGCHSYDNQLDTKISTTQNNYTLPASLLTCYTAEQPYYPNPDLEISQEQAKYIIMVWNDSSWDDGVKEAAYNYVFRGDNVEIQYCYDEGIFNDVVNNRHIVLSPNVKKQVNQTVDKFIVLPYVD